MNKGRGVSMNDAENHMKHKNLMSAASIGAFLLIVSGCGNTPATGDLYDAEEMKESIVGSRVKMEPRNVEDGATPVRVYSREEMRRNGSRSVGGFLGGNNL